MFNIVKEICSSLVLRKLGKAGKKITVVFPIFLKGEEYISIASGVFLDRGTRIEAWTEYQGKKYSPRVIIGKNVIFNPNCHIGAINKVIIKDNVLIGANVLITDHSHGKIEKSELKKSPTRRKLYSKGPVIIEKNVWIGENVAILPGVTVGANSIIGANAVVTHDVPEGTVVGGNPAKVIKIL